MKRLTLFVGMCLSLTQAMAQAPRPAMVVIAPHPDDAEASCGGLIANATAAGQEVVILSMTAGEIGVAGKTQEETRALRSGEARKAAAVLGAKVEFFGAIDGSLVADAANTDKLTQTLLKLHPATVLAPWPMDVHPDHQAAGILAWRAFQDRRSTFELYFYETTNAPHTMTFQFVPTDYVDITDVMKQKQEATYQHASQNPAEWFDLYRALARFRGFEADVPFAEGYIKARNSSGIGGRAGKTGKTLIQEGASMAPTKTQPAPLDWAQLKRYQAENASLRLPRPGERRVVFFGDSITDAWIEVAPAFFKHRPYVDRGISGQTTSQMLARFQQDVIALRPEAVVILAGTNDIAGNTGPYDRDLTLKNLESMAELAKAHEIRVVLASLLPAFDYPWSPGLNPASKIIELNALLKAYAARHGLTYLDYHSAMADERNGLKASLSEDGIHPNLTGYQVMGPLAEKAIKEALASN